MPPSDLRSRSGCRPCIAGRKKCGEEFGEDGKGKCKRCESKGIECVRTGPVPPAPPRRSSTAAGVRGIGGNPDNRNSTTPNVAENGSPVNNVSTPSWSPSAGPAPNMHYPLLASPPQHHLLAQSIHQPIASTSNGTGLPSINSHTSNGTTTADQNVNIGSFDEWAELVEMFGGDEGSLAASAWSLPQPATNPFEQHHPPQPISMPVPIPPVPIHGQGDGNSPSGVALADPDLPADVASIYAAYNTDFLQSLPKHLRVTVAQRWNTLGTSSNLGRAAMLAQCLLHSARSLDETQKELQARLLRKSTEYFLEAVNFLGETDASLEAKLNAIMDIHHHQLDQSGAAAAFAVLLVGERFIQEQMGDRPLLDLHSLVGAETLLLRIFAFTDVLRSVSLGTNRTFFHFNNLPPAYVPPPHSEFSWTYLGLPPELVLCFVTAINLKAEIGVMDPTVFKEKAHSLERYIKGWRPPVPDLEEMQDSLAYVTRIATLESWRHAALLYLYQSVLGLGCLSRPIRASAAQIIALGTIAPPASSTSGRTLALGSIRSCPWFLCATVSTTDEQRNAVRKGLESCGPGRVFRDNIVCAELIWAEMDEGGFEVDWRDLLRRKEKVVSFL
ncbi:Zn(2)-C6 fungal-type transcription factor [Pseudohyphozyma bogoriensis]|nr:Zn(2)-C6 fungal-type transcription factor [Pseudohyphozyma bogoriensis]